MMGGSIGKFGDVYTIDLRIIDVETAEILTTISEDHEGKMTGLLSKMKSIAFRLANDNKDKKYTLSINSSPSKAVVYVNNKRVGLTPFSVTARANSYEVKVSKKGYRDWKRTVKLLSNQVFNAELISDGVAQNQTKQPKIEETGEGSNFWLWTTVGVVVAGGALYFLAGSSDSGGGDDPIIDPRLPDQPPRP